MPKIIRRELPSPDALLGATIRTRKTEDGRSIASSPNYPDLKPVEADTPKQARDGFQRRLLAYGSTNMSVEKANAANVLGTSRDRLTCG